MDNKCPNCGAPFSATDRVCKYCGAELKSQKASDEVKKTDEVKKVSKGPAITNTGSSKQAHIHLSNNYVIKGKRRKGWLIALIVIVALVVIPLVLGKF